MPTSLLGPVFSRDRLDRGVFPGGPQAANEQGPLVPRARHCRVFARDCILWIVGGAKEGRWDEDQGRRPGGEEVKRLDEAGRVGVLRLGIRRSGIETDRVGDRTWVTMTRPSSRSMATTPISCPTLLPSFKAQIQSPSTEDESAGGGFALPVVEGPVDCGRDVAREAVRRVAMASTCGRKEGLGRVRGPIDALSRGLRRARG